MDLEDLTHAPVFDIETEEFLGYVIGTVVDPGRQRLLGVVTRTRFARPKMLAPADSIHLLHRDGVVIRKKGFRWLPMHRTIWAAARAQKKTGSLPVVLNKETVGSVVDCTATDDGRITHLMIQRGMIGKPVRVRRDKVTKVEDGVVHLAPDAFDKPKPRSQPKAKESAGGFVDEAAALFGQTLAKAAHKVKNGARSGLAGKPAPWTIEDANGRVLVERGEPLTHKALAAEAARGRTGELTGAVAGGALGRSLAKRRKKKYSR